MVTLADATISPTVCWRQDAAASDSRLGFDEDSGKQWGSTEGLGMQRPGMVW
jgi:hypothetical protein